MQERYVQEALDEWLIMDEQNMKFHMGQYERPYRSTVKFAEFLKQKDLRGGNGRILDAVQAQCWDIFWILISE